MAMQPRSNMQMYLCPLCSRAMALQQAIIERQIMGGPTPEQRDTVMRLMGEALQSLGAPPPW